MRRRYAFVPTSKASLFTHIKDAVGFDCGVLCGVEQVKVATLGLIEATSKRRSFSFGYVVTPMHRPPHLVQLCLSKMLFPESYLELVAQFLGVRVKPNPIAKIFGCPLRCWVVLVATLVWLTGRFGGRHFVSGCAVVEQAANEHLYAFNAHLACVGITCHDCRCVGLVVKGEDVHSTTMPMSVSH